MQKKYTLEELNEMHRAIVLADYFIKEEILELSKKSGAEKVIKCLEQLSNVKNFVWDELWPLKYPEYAEASK